MKAIHQMCVAVVLAIYLSACASQSVTPNRGPICGPKYRSAVTAYVVNLLPLETAKVTLEVYDCTDTLIAAIKPTWVSADLKVATVDGTGLIEAQASGNTEVYIVERELGVGNVVEVHVAANE